VRSDEGKVLPMNLNSVGLRVGDLPPILLNLTRYVLSGICNYRLYP
jgi:hypothetical protein